MTLVDLKERLAQWEECYLLEVLGLTSQDIIDRFEDVIEAKMEDLERELEDGFERDDE